MEKKITDNAIEGNLIKNVFFSKSLIDPLWGLKSISHTKSSTKIKKQGEYPIFHNSDGITQEKIYLK